RGELRCYLVRPYLTRTARPYLTRIFPKFLACLFADEGLYRRARSPKLHPKNKMKKNAPARAFALRITLAVALLSICSIYLAPSFANALRTTHSTSASRVENGEAPGATPTPTPTPAMTFTVTNTNDTGTGSLRQAILDATSM